MPDYVGPIRRWEFGDTIPTNAEGGYAGADSTAAAIANVGTVAVEGAQAAAQAAVATRITPGKNLVSTAASSTFGPQSFWLAGTTTTPDTTSTYAAYTATKPFPATSGATYTGTRISNVTFFAADGSRQAGWHVANGNHANPLTFTVPAGASQMAVSYPTSFAGAVQVEAGAVATAYEPFALTIPGLDLPGLVTYGWRHGRGATEEAGDATYNGAFYGYGLSALISKRTTFNRLAVRFASTQAPVRVRVYSLASMGVGALVPAGNGTTSLLLADLTLTSGYPTGSTPDEVLIDLGQDVTIDGGRYVVVLITTTAASKITVAKWQTNTPGDRLGLWLVTSAADAISGPGSLPVNGSTPPRLDYVAVPVQAIADQVDAALAPFPAHTYVDLWTSPVFDDGRNAYVAGQPAAAATTATAAAAKGATTLTVAATNLVAGMSLVTDATGPNGQVVRIASVAGGTLTLAAPLTHPIANAQRLDFLWQNASHLSASSGANFSGYAFLARTVLEAVKEAIPSASKIALLANSWAVQGSVQWSAQAADKYPGATFVNAGVGGNTTAQMLTRFDTDVPADSDLIILFEWVNDSYQGVTAGVQAAHWRELVTKALAITPNVVVVGPVPLNEHPAPTAAQESAATSRAGTSLRVLQLERRIAALEVP